MTATAALKTFALVSRLKAGWSHSPTIARATASFLISQPMDSGKFDRCTEKWGIQLAPLGWFPLFSNRDILVGDGRRHHRLLEQSVEQQTP